MGSRHIKLISVIEELGRPDAIITCKDEITKIICAVLSFSDALAMVQSLRTETVDRIWHTIVASMRRQNKL